jgi:tRNA A-37 threonylcarbamoyl transferase component Bud32
MPPQNPGQDPAEIGPDTPADSQDRTQLTAGGTPVAGEFAAGDIVGGDYQVIAFIGAGGMGNVYRVRHTIMHTEYALKTLSANKVTEVAWRRFQNEAQAIARMNHPNVVAIYNLGFHEGRLPYYVMNLLQGTTLSDVLKQKGRLEQSEALRMFIEICAGLGYAHKKGIVHRDIKPPNIVLLDEADPVGPRVKIVDFGIAKLSQTKDLANQQLTNVGEVCGSPLYMSPEQCDAGNIDARSDIYSLGCTLFEALTGSPPFKGRNAMETMLLHSSGTPPTLKDASGGKEFPRLLEMVVAKMLARSPVDRYQNMEQLARDLTTALQGANSAPINRSQILSPKNNSLAWISAALAILLIAAVSICLLRRGGATSDGGTPAVQAPAKVMDMRPFSKIVKGADGKTFIRFTFPADESIGSLWTYLDSTRRACKGVVEVPAGITVFAPGSPIIAHPEYLDRFGPSDLSGIEIDLESPLSSEQFDNTTLRHLTHLKGLTCLTIKGCSKINDEAMLSIEQLPDLNIFECEDSNITVARLSRSSILRRLTRLTISTKESISPLLLALHGSTTLILFDTAAQLTNADYRQIGTFINLRVFKCNGSGMHDRDLIALSPLKHLENLEALDNNLTLDAVPTLKALLTSHNKSASLASSHMTLAQLQRFRQALPGIEIE